MTDHKPGDLFLITHPNNPDDRELMLVVSELRRPMYVRHDIRFLRLQRNVAYVSLDHFIEDIKKQYTIEKV